MGYEGKAGEPDMKYQKFTTFIFSYQRQKKKEKKKEMARVQDTIKQESKPETSIFLISLVDRSWENKGVYMID